MRKERWEIISFSMECEGCGNKSLTAFGSEADVEAHAPKRVLLGWRATNGVEMECPLYIQAPRWHTFPSSAVPACTTCNVFSTKPKKNQTKVVINPLSFQRSNSSEHLLTPAFISALGQHRFAGFFSLSSRPSRYFTYWRRDFPIKLY